MRSTLLLLLTLLLLAAPALAQAGTDPLNIQVKKIYSAPDQTASLIYDIPLDVKLLDVSEDGNWYKVRIAFNLGPFNYTYLGWSHIPVGDFVAERAKKNERIAHAPVEPLPPSAE